MTDPTTPAPGAPRALVVTVSTRAAAGVYPDASGPALVELVRQYGFTTADTPTIVPDGPAVGDTLRQAVAEGVTLVLTTGGTGLAADDLTPEQTAPLLDRQVPGLLEAVRVAGVAAGAPAAMLSRGLAGVAGRTLIVNLPGSVRAIRQAMEAIGPALHHAADQIAGGDHTRTD